MGILSKGGGWFKGIPPPISRALLAGLGFRGLACSFSMNGSCRASCWQFIPCAEGRTSSCPRDRETKNWETTVSNSRDFIDGYRLARLIRVGQTCEVWEVIKVATDERFAMKILRPEQKGNRQETAALKNEFEIAGKLKHPNIIRIFEFKGTGDRPYLVMEVFAFSNLKILTRQGGYTNLYHLVPRIVDDSASALFYFHSQGFVHRDIKPDNFLVSDDGGVKMIDFAISMKVQTGFARWFGFRGQVQGTRSYMSPEQIRNQSLDQRADIYSFGCVLFELVSGRPPYTGDTPDDLLQRHLHSPVPSPLAYCPNLSQEFADLIRKMISKRKEDRPDSMLEFIKRFKEIKKFKIVPKPPVGWKPSDVVERKDVDDLKK